MGETKVGGQRLMAKPWELEHGGAGLLRLDEGGRGSRTGNRYLRCDGGRSTFRQ